MNNELMLDVGQANELKLAFRREGDWTNEKIKALTERRGLLKQVLDVIESRTEIITIKHMIDLDADPLTPYNGWSVEEHRKGGQFQWNPAKVILHFSKNQMDGKLIGGHDLRKELAKEPVWNANLLDHLLKYPHLIPEGWKKDENGNTRYIYFWGTIYCVSGKDLYVRFLDFGDGHWRASGGCLDRNWGGGDPAVLGAS